MTREENPRTQLPQRASVTVTALALSPRVAPPHRSPLRLWSAWVVAAALATFGTRALAAPEAKIVLVLYSNARLIQANVLFDQALRETVKTSAARPVVVLDAFLDAPYFEGPAYDQTFTTYLLEKYVSHPPDVVVAGGEDALRFLLGHRTRLFSKVPIVHMAVSRSYLRSLGELPSDVVGVPSDLNVAATIEQALRWHPRARRLVLVTGASQWDRGWELEVREEVQRFADRVTIEALTGLPMGAVLKRLSELGKDAVVFTPGFFEDGAHQVITPREAIKDMATASTAPMYVPFPVHLGNGVVGGYMWGFPEAGSQVGRIVNDLFDGVPPSALRLPELMPATLNVDWGQLKRWGIDESAVPAGAVMHFRVPTFFEQYRRTALIAAVVFLLQTTLVVLLLAERVRRRRAERAEQKQAVELVHASRVAMAGELTGAIAHEINQPLGAILANADAADLILNSGLERREQLQQILSDIRRDDVRASEVIRRLRALLAKHEVEKYPFDFNEALSDVESLLSTEARRRGVNLNVRPPTKNVTLVGDRVQVQQVLINLVLNAMDAVTGQPDDRRTVTLSVEVGGDRIKVAVRDRGNGIAPENLPRLFDSFFTTKQQGMGLGLSIARTLVHAHGGTIWAESTPPAGSGFFVELPTTNETSWPPPGEA